ncbi:GNAT family N-acetyltransferase [Pseudoxanthomonas sp.]|jgi:Predicted acetyltransferase|uniref:GNAT family N-acetyltransferase n=1 Tax=Pseudoxanthomonas sp. TaxID=1871049 RepID=UPI002FE3C3C0
MDTALDNPFWCALDSIHRDIALRSGSAARYPADYAPFLGVAAADAPLAGSFEALVAPGEAVYLLGVAPAAPAGWALHAFRPLAQMVCEAVVPVDDGPQIVPLDDTHRHEVLALTALVYPHYFRPRTMGLGRYFGIREDGRLAAMIGERLGSAGTREMSAICTHPDFTGRGYARHLTRWLTNDTLARGVLPFLHVSHENPRAKALYERLGYRVRRDIGFWSLVRVAD